MGGSLFEWVKWLATLVLLILLVLLIWCLISPLAYAARYALTRVGLGTFLDWLQQRLRALSIRKMCQDLWNQIIGESENSPARSVRIILDERLRVLQNHVTSAVTAFREGSSQVALLGGSGGAGSVALEVRGLQTRIEDLAGLGGEIPEELVEDYKGKSRGIGSIVFLVIILIASSIINGTLLNAFFRDLIPGSVLGIRQSYIASVVVVIVEFGLGYLLYANRQNRWAFSLFLFGIVLLAAVEAIIFGLMSYNFDFDVPLLDSDLSRFWLGLLGLAIVMVTSGVGYSLHKEFEEFAGRRGAGRFRKEALALNKLLRDLPGRWDAIRGKAQAAEASISSFEAALGNRAGALSGAVDRIGQEKDELCAALAAAHMENWNQWLEGKEGDAGGRGALNVLLALFTLGALSAFLWAYDGLLAEAFPTLSEPLAWAIALVATLACYTIGHLSFGRIQVNEAASRRVYAMRSGRAEQAAGIAIAICATAAFFWTGIAALGGIGFVVGLGMVLGGAALALLGYFFERTAAGAVTLTRFLLALAATILVVVLLLVAHAAGWAICVLAKLVLAVLEFLALPFDKLIQWRQAKRPSTIVLPETTSRPGLA